MKDTLLKRIEECGMRITAPKDIILNKKHVNPSANHVYLLEEGICALTSITKQGEEKVYTYFRPRRLISFTQLLVTPGKHEPGRPEFSVVTKTPCSLCQIPYFAFQELVQKDPEFNAALIETLADNYSDALIHFHMMKEEPAAVRLCHLLLEVSQIRSGCRTVPRFFTYAELAKYLGCHPVTVSRIMAKLKQRGFIKKVRSGITIQREEALKELINSESRFQY